MIFLVCLNKRHPPQTITCVCSLCLESSDDDDEKDDDVDDEHDVSMKTMTTIITRGCIYF